jgi:CDP-diglyceride synthetase
MVETFIHILILLVAANGMPVIASRVLQSRAALPVDLGIRLPDGYALFGKSKTWRGLVAAIVAGCVVAVLLGYGMGFGLVFGALVMLGDLLASFIKRRMGLAPSAQCLGVDQIPEALIPSMYAVFLLDINWWWAVLLALAFMLIELAVSRPLYWLHIRKRPY